MSTSIHFELVSPEEKLVSEDVYLAEMPGDDGNFGVMSGHCALLSSLRAGVVRLYKTQGGEKREIFIAGGFADVSPQNCTILAEEALDLKDLDKAALESELKDLKEDITLMVEEADKKRVSDKIAMTKAKISALTVY